MTNKAELEALRAEIRKGLESGPAEDFDVGDIIAEAKRRKAGHSHANRQTRGVGRPDENIPSPQRYPRA